jgi:RNA polymerase sigma factor (sigma-70 family)
MGSTRLVIEGTVFAELQVGGRVMEAAAERLYRASRTPVMRFFKNSGRLSDDEAEDVFQETIIRVIKRAGTYKGGGDAAAWIWAVARNVLMDYFESTNRRNTLEIPLNDDEWTQQVEQLAAAPECKLGQSVDECFQSGFISFREKMPDRAHVLEMMLDGSSIETIASLIDRGYDATKVYLSQCRKKLGPFISHCRELLEHEG